MFCPSSLPTHSGITLRPFSPTQNVFLWGPQHWSPGAKFKNLNVHRTANLTEFLKEENIIFSDIFIQGTTAHVGISLYGLNKSGSRHLNNSLAFQRNSQDIFQIETDANLGEIWKIRIWHDNTGMTHNGGFLFSSHWKTKCLHFRKPNLACLLWIGTLFKLSKNSQPDTVECCKQDIKVIDYLLLSFAPNLVKYLW